MIGPMVVAGVFLAGQLLAPRVVRGRRSRPAVPLRTRPIAPYTRASGESW